MPKDRPPSPEDWELWEQVSRNTAPLKGKAKAKPKEVSPWQYTPQGRSAYLRKREDTASDFISYFRKVEVQQFPGKVFRGRSFEARLDLHGMTVAEAEKSMAAFFQRMQIQNIRYAILITGKGKSPGSTGVLQQHIPGWLNGHPEFVVGYCCAKPEDGGAGALYVQIRMR